MSAAKNYLESISSLVSGTDGRYPVVLLHYQGNTSTEQKNLSHEFVRRVCEVAVDAGYVPVILDWDRRTPLTEDARIFNPGTESPLWGHTGNRRL